ncbi:MAG: type IV pili methyl-accepting chemotaxis transducer N-terminal domain-containing protein, partial [Alcaligenaceae bacterium]|nr:type IV pili methyl-accepting chemotaxis transducer N-terminal domain-containing protein [Alcaligenaceae bacterium]
MNETTVSRPRRPARRTWLQRQHDRSLGSKAAFVFVVVFALAAANIVTVSRIFGNLDDVAATVSVAGKLRMLSQKIAYSVALASTGDLSMMSQARRDIDDFGHAWRALGEGADAFGMKVRLLKGSSRADLARVDAIW